MNETWLCPICALVRMKYGTTCLSKQDGSCENLERAHLTGRQYLAPKPQPDENSGIGISRISDE